MFEKYIQTVDILTREECQQLIDYAEQDCFKAGWEAASVYDSDGVTFKVDETRTCERIAINSESPELPVNLHEKLNNAMMLYTHQLLGVIPKEYLRMPMPGSYGSSSRYETPGLLRYREGQHYDWHVDADLAAHAESHNRHLSVVLYLNDDFEGGATEFIDGARKPLPGQALIFPSNWNFLHSAQPVKKGTKYAIVTWYTFWLN